MEQQTTISTFSNTYHDDVKNENYFLIYVKKFFYKGTDFDSKYQ